MPGDADALHRALVDIVKNAADAMPNGGHLRVIARIVNPPATPISSVGIDVIDTGSGIPRHLLPRIFEPHFTTKTDGHGFGLSTSYRIVGSHGGRIAVESPIGKGATFTVTLPLGGPGSWN